MFTRAFNATIGRADGRNMILPLATDIEMVRGVGPHTFTRASSQYMNDFEGRLRKALSGKMGFPGMRLVENLCTAPNDFTLWNKYNGATVPAVNKIVFAGTPGGQVTFNINVLGAIRFTCEVKSDGTTQVPQALYLGGIQKAFTPDLEWKRVSILRTLTVSGAAVLLNAPAAPSSFLIRNALIENVTNQSNQNPSEFLLDGQSQWFDYLNPNTVDANGVVTDSGVRTKITGGKGGLFEPPSTNKCTGYAVPRADAYGSTLASGTATKGKVYEIVTRTSIDWGTVGTLLSGTANTVGAKYVITGSLTFTASDTGKECIDAVGTKAYHDGTAFQNPITGMTLSGDTAAVLSIVTDQAAIEAAGLAKQTNGYKLYSILTGAGGVGVIDFSGLFSAVTTSIGIRARVVSGSATLSDNTGANSVAVTGSAFSRPKKENFTAVAGRNARLTVAASSQVIFGFYQAEDQPYLTSDIPTLGATAPRAATISTVPRAGNLPATGLRRIKLAWTPWGSVTGTTQCLWSSYVDASNYVALWANNSIVYGEKRVAGVSEFVTFALTPTLLQTYEIDFGFLPDNTMFLKVDGVSAGSGLGSELYNGATPLTSASTTAWTPLYNVPVLTRGRAYISNLNITTLTGTNLYLYVGVATPIQYSSTGQKYHNSVSNEGSSFAVTPGTTGGQASVYVSVKEIYNTSTTLAPVLGSLITHGSFNGTKHCFGQLLDINTDR